MILRRLKGDLTLFYKNPAGTPLVPRWCPAGGLLRQPPARVNGLLPCLVPRVVVLFCNPRLAGWRAVAMLFCKRASLRFMRRRPSCVLSSVELYIYLSALLCVRLCSLMMVTLLRKY